MPKKTWRYYLKSSSKSVVQTELARLGLLEGLRHVPQKIKFIVGKNDVFYTQKIPEMWLWFVFDDTPEAQADKKHLAEWLASKANPDEPFSGDWMITNPPFSDN